jgi:hypothetical protein
MKINPDRIENFWDRLHANQCEVCGYTPEELRQEKHYAYYGGHYCSSECYDTLFDNCEECGKLNMTVVRNDKNGKGKICDACYMKKNNLTVCTIGGRF